MMYFSEGSPNKILDMEEIKSGLYNALDLLGKRSKVIAVPPDFTRLHSYAGPLTELVYQYYGNTLTDVLPAIGTHYPMTDAEISSMFGSVPKSLFRPHDWRNGLATLGEVPSEYVSGVSEGKVDYEIPIQVDKLIAGGNHDLILSIGQVVPHEVIGMANHNKNIFIGTGGGDGINKTHFLGAAYGMERIMGRANTPVKAVLNYGSDNFAKHLPLVYVLTVVGKNEQGQLVVRGLYIGDDIECFNRAAELSLQVNFELLEKPLKKIVVYLDPSEFKSTWLGNKSIYRTRMVLDDGGELIVLAPGLAQFGEDAGIDKLIRKYGYIGTPAVLDLIKNHEDLRKSLSSAAHLIHGSSEGRFTITYCPGKMKKEEIENVNFGFADLGSMMKKYNPEKLKDGMNTMPDGEEVFFISNPALGLWAYRGRFS